MKSFAAALALLLATGAQAAADPLSAVQIKAIDAIVTQAMAKQHISGVEIGIGRVALRQAQGPSIPQDDKAARPSTTALRASAQDDTMGGSASARPSTTALRASARPSTTAQSASARPSTTALRASARPSTTALRASAQDDTAGVVFAKGYGLRDRAKRLGVTDATIFPVGSITKQFTAACVMLLVQRGKVDLNARVSRYLPNAPHGSEVTVRELLNQTSGLPDYLEDKALLASIMPGKAKPDSVAHLVGLVAGKPLHFKPGSKWEYSNTNYALAGLIVERTSGMPLGRFLQTNIFGPAGMPSTQYLRWSVPAGGDVTRGYTWSKQGFGLLPNFSMDWGNAAGAIASNVHDLIDWDQAYFSGRIISLTNVRISTTPPPRIRMLPSKNRANNMGIGYAFGWVEARAEGRVLIWHNGGLPGARAMNAVFPKNGLAIVVLTNATEADPEDVALRIARAIFDGR